MAASLSPRLRQVAYGVACALVGVGLLYVAYAVLGKGDDTWSDVGAGVTGLFGITALLLSVFLFFVPAALAGK